MSTVLKWRADIDSNPVQLPVVSETPKRVVSIHPTTQKPTGEGKDCLDYSWHDSWESARQWRIGKLKQLRKNLSAKVSQIKQEIDALQTQRGPIHRGS
jgi:hypothetical protein